MDKNLRKLLRKRQDLRIKYHEINSSIIQYISDEFSVGYCEARADELKRTYFVAHLAEALTDEFHNQSTYRSIDEFAYYVLTKKGHLTKGNSVDRRTAREERAFGSAREAWSYSLREAGIR